MKRNTRVTLNEVFLNRGEQLITSTDLKGRITKANDDFVRVSGYSREELLGEHHNIVRHPDMPEAVFKNLWGDLKASKQWMGLVKNRAKDGGFYWVEAFVAPILEGAKVVGYESVRVKPSQERVRSAEKLYAKLQENPNKSPASGASLVRQLLIGAFLVVAGISLFAYLNGVPAMHVVSSALLFLMMSYGIIAYSLRPLLAVAEESKRLANNAVIQNLFSGRDDEIGQIQYANTMLEGRLRTVVGCIDSSVKESQQTVAELAVSSLQCQQAVSKQQGESTAVLHAVSEMNGAIQGLAKDAVSVSAATGEASALVSESKVVLNNTASSISELHDSMEVSSQVISQLETDSETINSVLHVIEHISEQTNLLALNAAIEAARAGQYGRGFAVVAEEIRSLSMRTQDSTVEIQEILERLQSQSQKAGEAMQRGSGQIDVTVESVRQASESLSSAATAITRTEDMSVSIATAVDQQSRVIEAINSNVKQISELAQSSAGHSAEATKLSADVSTEIKGIGDMALRFKSEL